jgi:hypothetical protein
MTELYRAFDVWKLKEPHTAIRYRCFESLANHRFCVQSADFYRLPLTSEQINQLEKQFVELLLEEPPIDRSGVFDSIEEAIDAHQKAFS